MMSLIFACVEKKDPTKHDFKPEWATFWGKRMRELHDEYIEKKKAEIRKSLNLGKDDRERVSGPKEKYDSRGNRKRSESLDSLNDDAYSRLSQDKRDKYPRQDRDRHERARSSDKNRKAYDSYKQYNRERSHEKERERDRERDHYDRGRKSDRDRRDIDKVYRKPTSRCDFDDGSRSPHPYDAREDYNSRGNPYKWHAGQPKSQYYSSRYYQGREMSPSKIPKYDEPIDEEPEDDSPLTVVTVLRLLSALEELLGPSLGPKIVELLAKALALEKVKANAADELLLNEENCVLFETIKEKLKGQLIADMIERHRTKAVKKAIKDIAGLIHLASKIDNKTALESVQNDSASVATSKSAAALAAAATASSSISSSKAAESTAATPTNAEKEEKVAIAKKIASALIAQGKADIPKEELESLVNYYYEKQQKARLESQAQKEVEPKAESIRGDTPSSIHTLTKEESIDLTEGDEMDNTQNDDDNELEFGLPQDASSALESLTDSDLQTLLQNFEDLSAEEQTHLHTYMKKLEASDPERVEKLRKYVKKTETETQLQVQSKQLQSTNETALNYLADPADLLRPEPNRLAKSKATNDPYADMFYDDTRDGKPHVEQIIDSDDDDDYSYDDVCKAASKNIADRKLEHNNWVC